MSTLDEQTFARLVAACPQCGGARTVVHAYLDRTHEVMVGERNDEGRWAYNGEGFIDGVFRIECADCGHCAFGAEDCPRCHSPGTLQASLRGDSRLAVPKKCPRCSGLETQAIGFAPSRTEVAAGKPGKPMARALLGEPGFHVIAMACGDCDWAIVAEGCPLCGRPSPIRARPS